MDLHLYTRGHLRDADYLFIGPGTSSWWTAELGHWLQSERPTVVARREHGRFEVALCGLPTSRQVTDGTAIVNQVVLGADVGTDEARAVLAAARDWFEALIGSPESSDFARLVDGAIDAELVEADLGLDSDAARTALRALADDVVKRFGDAPPGAAPASERLDAGWIGSIGTPEAQHLFSGTLAALAEGTADDGFVAAHLNRARAEADGQAALRRLGGPGALVLLGDEMRDIVSPKAPGPGPTPTAEPRRSPVLVAVAVGGGVLLALLFLEWLTRALGLR